MSVSKNVCPDINDPIVNVENHAKQKRSTLTIGSLMFETTHKKIIQTLTIGSLMFEVMRTQKVLTLTIGSLMFETAGYGSLSKTNIGLACATPLLLSVYNTRE